MERFELVSHLQRGLGSSLERSSDFFWNGKGSTAPYLRSSKTADRFGLHLAERRCLTGKTGEGEQVREQRRNHGLHQVRAHHQLLWCKSSSGSRWILFQSFLTTNRTETFFKYSWFMCQRGVERFSSTRHECRQASLQALTISHLHQFVSKLSPFWHGYLDWQRWSKGLSILDNFSAIKVIGVCQWLQGFHCLVDGPECPLMIDFISSRASKWSTRWEIDLRSRLRPLPELQFSFFFWRRLLELVASHPLERVDTQKDALLQRSQYRIVERW